MSPKCHTAPYVSSDYRKWIPSDSRRYCCLLPITNCSCVAAQKKNRLQIVFHIYIDNLNELCSHNGAKTPTNTKVSLVCSKNLTKLNPKIEKQQKEDHLFFGRSNHIQKSHQCCFRLHPLVHWPGEAARLRPALLWWQNLVFIFRFYDK